LHRIGLLQDVRDILKPYRIPLVLDATRILENASHIKQFEAGQEARNIWDIVEQICGYADALTASLGKDFSLNVGGVVAVNNAKLFSNIKDNVLVGGSGLNTISTGLIASSLSQRSYHIERVNARLRHVQILANALREANVPIIEPVNGHCVLIDVYKINAFADLDNPLAAFLAWLYKETDVRAGVHVVGMQKNTVFNNTVRLAVPIGLNDIEVEQLAARLAYASQDFEDVFDLELVTKSSGLMADSLAEYRLSPSTLDLVAEQESNLDKRAVCCIKSADKPLKRLLVFHPFGFGVNSISWVDSLPDELEVWAVGAEHLSNWQALLAYLGDSIKTLFDKPVVAWGHSMGGVVAYEVTHFLEKNYDLSCEQLIVSSSPSPILFEGIKDSMPFSKLDVSMPKNEIESILLKYHVLLPEESEVACISVDGLRNDIALCKTYRFNAQQKVNSPLCFIHAENDIFLDEPKLIQQWSEMTSNDYRHQVVDGTHAFFADPPQVFIDILLEICQTSNDEDVAIASS